MATKTKKVTKEKVEKKEEKVKTFRFEVLVNDLHFKTTADNLKEAIEEFMNSKDFPAAIKTKVILRFGEGETLTQHLWPLAEARRVFSNLDIKPELTELFASKLSRQL